MVFSCTEKHNLFKTLHKVLFQLKKKKKKKRSPAALFFLDIYFFNLKPGSSREKKRDK